jgi:hypothetical protein
MKQLFAPPSSPVAERGDPSNRRAKRTHQTLLFVGVVRVFEKRRSLATSSKPTRTEMHGEIGRGLAEIIQLIGFDEAQRERTDDEHPRIDAAMLVADLEVAMVGARDHHAVARLDLGIVEHDVAIAIAPDDDGFAVEPHELVEHVGVLDERAQIRDFTHHIVGPRHPAELTRTVRYAFAMRAIVVMLAACGGGHTTRATQVKPPPDAAVQATIVLPPVDAAPPARDCWSGSGAVDRTINAGDTVPPPTSETAYPLHYAILPATESTRRANLLHARYPDFEFFINDLGIVTELTTDRMPCAVRDEIDAGRSLTMTTQPVIKAYAATLATEIPDVPFLDTDYNAHPYRATHDLIRLALDQTRDVPGVITRALPKVELDDAALTKKWAGSRIQLFQLITTTKTFSQANPCLGSRHIPCDPPGPRVVTSVLRKLRGERPFTAKFVDGYERTTIVKRTPTGVEVRRVAVPTLRGAELEQAIFGPNNEVEMEMPNDIVITGAEQRDAITGDALPAR